MAAERARDRINQLKQELSNTYDPQERHLVKMNLAKQQISFKRCIRWWALDAKAIKPAGQKNIEENPKKESLLPPHLRETIKRARREKRKKG